MHIFVALMSSVVLVSSLSRVTAICCGSGKHGYCNDCSKVGAGKRYTRHCCYNGSSYKESCNIFCCNCKKCIAGHPIMTHVSGWMFRKKYTCRLHHRDAEAGSLEDAVTDTRDVFDKFDQDADGVVNKREFLAALKAHFRGANRDIMTSDLIMSDGADDLREDVDHDFVRMAASEFSDMDRNDDGVIQANEFDRNLEDYYY